MTKKLYIVTVIDSDGTDGEYWVNASEVKFARRFALRSHAIETGGAYCEIHSVQGPFDYDDEYPVAVEEHRRRQDKRSMTELYA